MQERIAAISSALLVFVVVAALASHTSAQTIITNSLINMRDVVVVSP